MNVSPKVTAGGASGAVVLIIVWVLSSCGVTMPPEVASALTVLVGALAGYLTPDRLRELGAHRAAAGRHADNSDGVADNAATPADPVGDTVEPVPDDQPSSDTKADAAL